MEDICAQVSELSREIRNMLDKSRELVTHEETLPDGTTVTHRSRLNQTAALDGNKITDIKSSKGAYHRTPRGKAVIYTGHPAYPTLEPNSRDIEEIIEHKRPFMCRILTAFGKPELACYTPSGDKIFEFVKGDMEQTKEAISELEDTIEKTWGVKKPQTGAEKSLMRELRKRNRELSFVLDDLAPNIIKVCKRSL